MEVMSFFESGKIPPGWKLVNETALQHPDSSGAEGALIRNSFNGVYMLHNGGANIRCPQEWAESNDQTRN